jgi:S1-C subfamily serine protease
MDGAQVYSIEDLSGEIHNRKIGDRVKITVYRRGREQAFEVMLSRMP